MAPTRHCVCEEKYLNVMVVIRRLVNAVNEEHSFERNLFGGFNRESIGKSKLTSLLKLLLIIIQKPC